MFQFTTTNVMNSNFDVANQDMNRWAWTTDPEDMLMVKGVGSFKPANVKSIHVADPTDAKMAEMKIDLNEVSGIEKGTTLRLSIYVRLTQADQSSYYANDYQYKGRPFTVEFPWLGTPEKTAMNLKKLIKKYGLMVFEKELIKTTVTGGEIILKAVNEFQRFHSYKLEYFVESKEPFGETWKELDEVITIVEEGKEAFGDYGWILRNLRLPTGENTRAFSPMAHEMPIPGAKYKQVTIEYCVNRGPLGLNAVGDTVKSVTTHVFYVNESILGGDLKDFGIKEDGNAIEAGVADFIAAIEQLATSAGFEFAEKQNANGDVVYKYTVAKENSESNEEVQG